MKKFMIWAVLFVMIGLGYVDGITNLGSECLQAQNSTVRTVYQSNLRTLLDSLVTNAPLQDGFFNTSVGNGLNQVYGVVWCRADVSPRTCSECLNNSISIPLRDCPESTDMEIWSSLCTLRFSNQSFFGDYWNSSSSSTYGNNGVDDPSVFSRGFSMMESLARNVSNRPLMFATSVVEVGENKERYGLGQCSRDLSKLDCTNCLEKLLTTFETYVVNRTGWEMQGVSCGLWYDDVRFYDENSGSAPIPNDSGGGQRWYKGGMILAFVGILVIHWIP